RAAFVRNDYQPDMGDLTKVNAEVLTLVRRAVWAERVLLHEDLAICLPTIRREFHDDLLSPLHEQFLCIENHAPDPLRSIELQDDLLGCILPAAQPPSGTPTRSAIQEVFDR